MAIASAEPSIVLEGRFDFGNEDFVALSLPEKGQMRWAKAGQKIDGYRVAKIDGNGPLFMVWEDRSPMDAVR